MRLFFRPFGILLLLALFATGCYTLLHHPSEVAMIRPAGEHFVNVPCSDCHYESEWLGYYDHQLIYGSNDCCDPWWDYYRRPWWYDGYWGDGGWYYTEAVPSGSKSSWRKRGESRGRSGSNETVIVPVAPRGGSGSGGSSSSSPSSSQSSESKKKSEPQSPSRKKETR